MQVPGQVQTVAGASGTDARRHGLLPSGLYRRLRRGRRHAATVGSAGTRPV